MDVETAVVVMTAGVMLIVVPGWVTTSVRTEDTVLGGCVMTEVTVLASWDIIDVDTAVVVITAGVMLIVVPGCVTTRVRTDETVSAGCVMTVVTVLAGRLSTEVMVDVSMELDTDVMVLITVEMAVVPGSVVVA